MIVGTNQPPTQALAGSPNGALQVAVYVVSLGCLIAPSALGLGSVDSAAPIANVVLLAVIGGFAAVVLLGLAAAAPLTSSELRSLLLLPLVGLALAPFAVDGGAAVVGAATHLALGFAIGAAVVVLGRRSAEATLTAAMLTVLLLSVVVSLWGPEANNELFSADPGLVGLGKFRGVLEDPNQAGRLGVVALILCVRNWNSSRSALLYRLGALLAAGVLIASQSRTAWIATLTAAVIWALWNKRHALLIAVIALAAIAALTIGSLSTSVDSTVLEREDSVGEVQTLTGRTDVWAESIQAGWERPFHGYGFNSASAPLHEAFWMGDIRFPAGHAHNLFLQVFLAQGTLGLAILAVALVRIGKSVARSGIVEVVLFSTVLVGTLTESLFVGRPDPYFFALALCAAASTKATGEPIAHSFGQQRSKVGERVTG